LLDTLKIKNFIGRKNMEHKEMMLRAKYQTMLERGLVEFNEKLYEKGKRGLEELNKKINKK